MSEELASLLNLRLAWQRVRFDLTSDRVFVRHPCEALLIEDCLEQWLEQIAGAVRSGQYIASPPVVAEVPKGGGAVRPGTTLALADHVVYTALVGTALAYIAPTLEWISPPVALAYPLKEVSGPNWLGSRFASWTSFRERSLQLLGAGATYVVDTDIAGFYDHVALRLLISDLKTAGVPDVVARGLSTHLSRWAGVKGRGIPQGTSASDVLGKLYLTRIDQALRELDFVHLRYVDEFRIFCDSRAKAKLAMMSLQRLLRLRGLSLQSAKTAIRRSDVARENIDGIAPVLQPLAATYKEEIAALAGLDPAYVNIKEAEALLTARGASLPMDMVRAVYKTYFIDTTEDFHTSLFHFLLNRLAKAKDDFAAEHTLTLIEEHPEETAKILEYLSATGQVQQAESALLDYLECGEAVYPYQHYLIVRWRALQERVPGDRFIAYVRRTSLTNNLPSYLRAACRMFLGRFGSLSDLDRLEEEYASATCDQERAELICSMARIEVSRRNGFLGEARRDGLLASRAAARVSTGQLVWEGTV